MRRRSPLLAACLCGLVASAATAKTTASLKLLRVRTVHAGAVAVTLHCAPGSRSCRATATLTGRTSDGRAAARIAPGRTWTLTVGLNASAEAQLEQAGTLRTNLRVLQTANGLRRQVAIRKLRIVAAFVSLGPRLVAYAKQFTGVPYLYGGNGPSSFDCSGFTVWVYAHFGYQLPRTSWDQMAEGVPVKGPLRLGDLVFWDAGGHVGIYTGDDTFISATVHRGIWIYSFQLWSQTQSFTTARRILGTAPIRVFPARNRS